MSVPDLTTYEGWDLQKPAIPTRSRLYQLEPIGMGTPYVESLTSYIQRLAEAHCVLPGVLMERELAPFLKKFESSTELLDQRDSRTGVFGHTGTLNGIGIMAMDWVRALHLLNQRSDLHFLTMLTWDQVFPAKGLLRDRSAYCPDCYEEWRALGLVIYEPLLWALQGVCVCPRHHKSLYFHCFHCQQKRIPLGWYSRCGYCSSCGQWLGSLGDTEFLTQRVLTQKQFSLELWAATKIGDLIGKSDKLPCSPERERIGRVFSTYIDELTDGNIASFARLLGKPKNTVWMWKSGSSLPQLSVLTETCYRLGIPLLDFLTGDLLAPNLSIVNGNSQVSLANVEVSTKLKTNYDLDLNKLEQALLVVKNGGEYPPPSIAAVAKRLNYNVRFLRRHFKDLCAAISAQYLNYRHELHKNRVQQSCLLVQQAALEIYTEGSDPTRSRISRRLKSPAYFREKDVCAALDEVRYQLGLPK